MHVERRNCIVSLATLCGNVTALTPAAVNTYTTVISACGIVWIAAAVSTYTTVISAFGNYWTAQGVLQLFVAM